MIDRKTDYNSFVNKDVEIILENSMHYTGDVISVGEEFIRLFTTREEDVFIVIRKICSIKEVVVESGKRIN